MSPIIICEFGLSPPPAWDFEAWCLMANLAGATHVKVTTKFEGTKGDDLMDYQWAIFIVVVLFVLIMIYGFKRIK